MKCIWILFVVILAGGVGLAKGQTASTDNLLAEPEVIALGKRKIRLPAPVGLMSAKSRFPKIIGRLQSVTLPASELLSAYVANGLQDDEISKVDIFATSQISKASKTSDIRVEEFTIITSGLERREGGVLFDPASPIMKETVRRTLKDPPNPNAGMQSLGVFDRRSNIFGSMFLKVTDSQGGKIYLVGAGSFVYVGRRMIYVAIYKRLVDEKDIVFIRDIARKWNDQIVDANK
jgi:hypothetical protein